MGGSGGCGQAYDSHDWSQELPRTCRACGAVDLGMARLFRAARQAIEAAGFRVYDDR